MKGQTNAQAGVTVKTGVTVDMIKNIPEDMPWDLTFTSSLYDKTIIRGIGPVSTTSKVITGTRINGSGSSKALYVLNSIYVSVYNVTTVEYMGRSSSSSSIKYDSFQISNSEFASAKLYLYGGGDSDLLNIGTPLYAEVSA